MHLQAATWLLRMGTRMLRYGGTFTETVQGPWESSRGPSWLRPPCTAGKGMCAHEFGLVSRRNICNYSNLMSRRVQHNLFLFISSLPS